MKKWFCSLLLAACFVAVPLRVAAEEAEVNEPETITQTIETGTTDSEPTYVAYVTTANLNLRTEPTTESTRLETYPRGTVIWVVDFLDYEWYRVEVGDRSGYMKAEFLKAYDGEYVEEDTPEGEPFAETVTYAETAVGTVELLDWADAKKLFTVGTPAQIIDVRTKIIYWVASFSNGKHADVEPITTDDTDAMKRTYGGRWSWDTRPILVIINGRTLAASINGMPHGGGVNSKNGMNGQICIHFRGSKTHNGNRTHENDHQNSVTEAFNTAQRW